MIIKNLTSKVQELNIVEFVGGRVFTIYLEGKASTEIAGAYLPDARNLKGIIEVVGANQDAHRATPIDIVVSADEDVIEETPSTQEGNEELSSEDETADTADTFICEECGAEFGSARGLASHQTRAHNHE